MTLGTRLYTFFNGALVGTDAEGNRWLHRTVNEPPVGKKRPVKPWQKEHRPNATGTTEAYRPPGSEYEGGRRAKATGDYEPWRPS
jgi:NADH:ubiquinone oxidoreductase subunit